MQNGSVRSTVLLCLALISIVLGMLFFKMTRVPTLSDEQLREKGVVVLPTPRELAPFDLIDHRGEPFSAADFQGRWSFVFFGFTNCPDICPTSMSVLAKARRQVEEQHPNLLDGFNGVLVSVDPE